MPPVLALYEDVFSNAATLALPPMPRLIFLVHGGVTVADRTLSDGEAWQGEGAATLAAGTAGATCWRFELTAAAAADGMTAGVASRAKLSARLDTLPAGDLLLRADSVGFPPGGCAYLHRHQGPGIRCLIEGGIRIDTHGRSTSYGPGGAWYETGPDAGVRAGRRRSSEPLHPRDDPAARAARAKARSSTSTRPTRTSRACSNTRSSPTRRSHDRRSSFPCTARRSDRAATPSPISRRCWPRPRRCAAATCSPASPPASGEERVAAQYALADLPLATLPRRARRSLRKRRGDAADRRHATIARRLPRSPISPSADCATGSCRMRRPRTPSPRSPPASRPRWRRR